MPTITHGQLIEEVKKILDKSDRTGSFNREQEARVNQMLRMAELLRSTEISADRGSAPKARPDLFNQARGKMFERTIDAASLEFFGVRRQSSFGEKRSMSLAGQVIEEQPPTRWNGKPIGACTILRDLSSMVTPEMRTYAGLSESVSGSGIVPQGFVPTVIAALKRTSQLLEFANWSLAATSDGRQTKIPTLTDTSTSAVLIQEADTQTFANPVFGQLAFDYCPTWTSKVVRASVQIDRDAVPPLIETMADAFRIRFSRGFGASVASVVVSDAAVGATAASSSAITQKDVLELMKGLDAQYAVSERAAFAMTWGTLMYLLENFQISSTSADAAFFLRGDGNHYLLFNRPVLIDNALPDIGASNKPIFYGDWNRLVIRNVPSDNLVRRYDELFAPNMEVGYEMLLRADAAIAHGGGAGDDPIVALQMHS